MAAPLYYEAVISFYQKQAFTLFSRFTLKDNRKRFEEPLIVTCKSPVGLTRQERYQHIKALMNK